MIAADKTEGFLHKNLALSKRTFEYTGGRVKSEGELLVLNVPELQPGCHADCRRLQLERKRKHKDHCRSDGRREIRIKSSGDFH